MTAAELLERVRRIELRSRRISTAALAGAYASVFKGRGVEFADLRPYEPGDDVRTIDWAATARTGSVYVRRQVEERELTVLFLADHSASMAFGSERQTKLELAAELAAVLALAATSSHDRVGAILFADAPDGVLPPAAGRRQVLHLIREIVAAAPHGTTSDLAGALALAARLLHRRAVVFVLSDWMATGYDDALARLARQHDVIAVQIADRRERALPNVGVIAARDPEGGGWRWIDSDDPAVGAAIASATDAFDATLGRTLRHAGVDWLRLDTGAPYLGALLRFLHARERSARRVSRTA